MHFAANYRCNKINNGCISSSVGVGVSAGIVVSVGVVVTVGVVVSGGDVVRNLATATA